MLVGNCHQNSHIMQVEHSTVYSLKIWELRNNYLLILIVFLFCETLSRSSLQCGFVVAVPNDDIIWPCKEKRTIINIQSGARSLLEVLWKMEWSRPSRICRKPTRTNVPLSARTHKFLFKTYVTAGLYFTFTK